ncbi:carbon storage regulator [Caldalkalibacillus uzonensis]|uniref:Carbon storage regulator n=1 Tax=Caldalkalibacillus uzonensis TaxID=353224 RepID=A0ABU0CU55_9BACI|nr:carbon storage regulator [Caldalkalibacillus uzonensis]
MSRKKGESIIIDDQIEVKVVAVEGDVVKLGIEAPKSVSIHRQEVYRAIQEENQAARMADFDPEWLRAKLSRSRGK